MKGLSPPMRVLGLIAWGFYLYFACLLGAGPGAVDPAPLDAYHKPGAGKEIRVSLTGEIEAPGIYHFTPSQTVGEAIGTAGGPTAMGDLTRLNLQAALMDDSDLKVPCQVAGFDTPVSLNRSSMEELMSLPGVGPALAGRIVEYRERHGPYRKITDLLAVAGIGPKSLERIRPLVVLR